MAAERQELLQEAWLGGKKGCLGALAEARAWALREVWQEEGKPDYGLLDFVASRVEKVGGENPSPSAISQFFDKIDEDKEWFPGKRAQVQYGPQPAIIGVKRRRIAQAAMTMKENKHEPTYARLCAEEPDAVVNPATGRPVDKKIIYAIFKEDCYDEHPDRPWRNMPRYAKAALTPKMMEKRLAFASLVASWRHTALWFLNHVIWADICNSILPRTEATADAQALARKGSGGWVSAVCEYYSCNLRGKQEP